MSDKASEMMRLLQELALMKELDERYEGGDKSAEEKAEYEKRRVRRQELSDQIVSLGGALG